MVASRVPPIGDLAHNPGMCPDWESNQQTFGLQTGAQSTEPHHPGLEVLCLMFKFTLSEYPFQEGKIILISTTVYTPGLSKPFL